MFLVNLLDESAAAHEKAAGMDNCVHCRSVNAQNVKKVLLQPTTWACQICKTTDNVWVCLVCGFVGCGRRQGGHARQHGRQQKHPVALDMNMKYCHCYICNDYVMNSASEEGDLQLIRDMLDDLHAESPVKVKRTRSGCVFSTTKANDLDKLLQQEVKVKDDKLDTADAHFRFVSCFYAFKKWKLKLQKSENKKSSQENDGIPQVQKPPRPQRRYPERPSNFLMGKAGLRNLGNTCYMNAVLQALGHSTHFRDFLVDGPAPKSLLHRTSTEQCFQSLSSKIPAKDSAKVSLYQEMRKLFRVLWSGKWAVISPQSLVSAVWLVCPIFRGFRQQDAQEFYTCALNSLHDELVAMGLSRGHNDVEGKMSVVSDTFGGIAGNEVICRKCSSSSKRKQHFNTLHLYVPAAYSDKKNHEKGCTIMDCFNEYMKQEELSGTNKFMCEKCKKHTSAVKKPFFDKMNEVVVIHVVRAKWDGGKRKVQTHVAFPLQGLDLSECCPDTAGYVYDLSGVVQHSGSGMDVGHYTAYCYYSEQKAWYYYNDERVKPATAEQVMKSQAYLLFYSRRERRESDKTHARRGGLAITTPLAPPTMVRRSASQPPSAQTSPMREDVASTSPKALASRALLKRKLSFVDEDEELDKAMAAPAKSRRPIRYQTRRNAPAL